MAADVRLRHITHIECPICGAKMRRAIIEDKHTNGEQFESTEYFCGLILAYVPNFSDFQFKSQCGNATDILAKEKGLKISLSKY